MGYKTVKEKYDIGHIVQVDNGDICIGSPYIHDIVRITPEGHVLCSWDRPDGDLDRYLTSLRADAKTGELQKAFDATDTFGDLIPVYKAIDGRVEKMWAEAFGWPNTTTTGEMQYQNFSLTRKEAVSRARRRARSELKYSTQNLAKAAEIVKRWTVSLLRLLRAYTIA